MAGEYIFSITDLSKSYDSRKVLQGINLFFYHGAKIGIVGENGSGKSTLLKIMAGIEKEYEGRAEPLKGTRIGFLPQEPELEQDKTVREIVEEAFASTQKLIDDFNEVSASMAHPMSDEEMEKAMKKMGKLQDAIDAAEGWEIDRQVNVAMDALVLPPRRPESLHPFRRRGPPGGSVPTSFAETRYPASRRTHQPPRCGNRPMA